MKEIVVGEDVFVIDRLSPRQVAGVARIVGRLLRSVGADVRNLTEASEIDVIGALLEALDENMLIELGCLITLSDKKYVEENFSLSWIVAGFLAMLDEVDIQGIVANFTQIASRAQE